MENTEICSYADSHCITSVFLKPFIHTVLSCIYIYHIILVINASQLPPDYSEFS